MLRNLDRHKKQQTAGKYEEHFLDSLEVDIRGNQPVFQM